MVKGISQYKYCLERIYPNWPTFIEKGNNATKGEVLGNCGKGQGDRRKDTQILKRLGLSFFKARSPPRRDKSGPHSAKGLID